MNARAVVTFWALAATATADIGAAQSLGLATGRDLPAWMVSWSPLDSHADLPRLMPSASTALPLLLLPPPKVGLFWLTGNPAAFPADVGEAYSNFMSARSGQSGDYRRPLDPGGSSLTQVSAVSWRPVGTQGAAIGRIIVDQETLDPGSKADVTQPYTSNPFVVTDTSTSPMRRVRARLEGAAGARLGPWAVGGALGYETRDNYTVHAAFARFDRQVTPALTVGLTRSFGDSGLTVGVHGRWSGGAETIEMYQNTLGGRIYQLEGYSDVVARDQVTYYRRMESDEASAGAGASGRMGAGRWVVFGDWARYRDGLWSQLNTDNPAKDRWETHAWSVGAAVQQALWGGRWLLTVQGRWFSLNGQGDLAMDSAGVIFWAHEHSLSGSAELRLLPVEDGWTAVAVLSVVNERRNRADSAAGIWTTLETLTPGIAIEAGRTALRNVFVSGGVAIASYMPRGEIPERLARGTVYQTLIAPEMDFYATKATTTALSLGVRWQVRDGTALWLAARSETLSPTSGYQQVSGYSPQGSRTASYVAVGVSLSAAGGSPPQVGTR